MSKVVLAAAVVFSATMTAQVLGQGRQAVFPAQQRPPGDPVLIERGKGIYVTTCAACHGQDLRGGATGGPNLLRSQVVLNDQKGELILPIVRGARAERGMSALPLGDDDVVAVAEYIHSVSATARNQGAPPPTEAPPPDPIVGDASAGEVYFKARCSSCHSGDRDLKGIATRIPDGKALQNGWITGAAAAGRGGRGRGAPPPGEPRPVDPRAVIATVTLPGGERISGPIVRMDNFLITLRLPDGSQRTVRRTGAVPKVELQDPLAGHKALLAILTDKDMHDVTAYLAGLK
ncbi:MAG: c-type cytochrome [Vicinamibacterales bacterium]